MKQPSPTPQIFEKLFHKNEIKPRGTPSQAIFPEILDPSVILAKTSATPAPLDFQPVCIYASIEQNKLYKLFFSFGFFYSKLIPFIHVF